MKKIFEVEIKLKMNPNLTQEQLKQQASMIGQMSDEQLKTAAA